MRDDKLIEAMAILERMQSYDTEGKDPLAASALRQWAGEVRDALAALKGFEGKSVMASFADNTWTFEMVGDYRVGAGRYLIVPLPAAPQPEEAP